MKLFIFLFTFLLVIPAGAQVILLNPHDNSLTDSLGSEMIFAIDVTNNTNEEQTIYIVRTQNILPPSWYSALCFDVCFSFELDSVVTSPEYGSSPLQANETREISVHVLPYENHGTGTVEIKVVSVSDSQQYFFDFTANTAVTSVNEVSYKPENYSLSQNYPNPFNPSTKINYGVKEGGQVTLKVYNILGVEIATLVNGYKPAGTYEAFLNASATGGLSSGVYIYSLSVNGFRQTRKMILEK